MISNVHSMEVWGETRGETKDPEKKLLINENQEPSYSSLSNPYASPSNAYHKYSPHSWLRYSAKVLPIELQKHIIGHFVKLYFRQHNIDLESRLDIFLNEQLKLQNIDLQTVNKIELNSKSLSLNL